jgi:hypothetical protein
MQCCADEPWRGGRDDAGRAGIYDPEPSPFIGIEEPENFLHPCVTLPPGMSK